MFQSPLRALYLPAHHSVALLQLLPSPLRYLKVVAVGPWFPAETARPSYSGSDTLQTMHSVSRLKVHLNDITTSTGLSCFQLVRLLRHLLVNTGHEGELQVTLLISPLEVLTKLLQSVNSKRPDGLV